MNSENGVNYDMSESWFWGWVWLKNMPDEEITCYLKKYICHENSNMFFSILLHKA
jgi:hypothetical protein